jgi:starch synthase (maltosyl-transferring)
MAVVNRIRKENPALQTTWNIYFADSHNDQLLCYGKTDDEKENKIIVVINLDSVSTQSGWIKVPVQEMGISTDRTYNVLDLITGNTYSWNGEWNYVELNPYVLPVHIFKVEQ